MKKNAEFMEVGKNGGSILSRLWTKVHDSASKAITKAKATSARPTPNSLKAKVKFEANKIGFFIYLFLSSFFAA